MSVYKDECTYCFDLPELQHGIDVCLQCKLATSPNPDRNYTAMHAELTGHGVFVNIKKTVKMRQPKQIKLAIDAKSDEDIWETHTLLKDASGNTLEASEEQNAVVAQILAAKSFSQEQEIAAWQLETKPCAHSAEIVYTNPAIAVGELREVCHKCDLTDNLWLCLICGTVSCGRAQFGGGGGNGHSLDHFETTSHSIAVKIGAISGATSDVTDAFCYTDDDDVKVPNMAAHLRQWGIDVATRQKTEKSMVELQLEQNAKWDFTPSDSSEELIPVSGPGKLGLKNLGNTCYLNSVLQSLMSLPQFRELFPSNDPLSPTTRAAAKPAEDLIIQLRKLQDGLQSGRYCNLYTEGDGQRGLSPSLLKYIIGRGHPDFSTMQQQDAAEFLSHFLTKLTKASKEQGLEDPVKDLFGFDTVTRIQCTTCQSVSYKPEHQESLAVLAPAKETNNTEAPFGEVSFKELIETYCKTEEVELRCGKCKTTRPVTLSRRLVTSPKILVISVMRVQIENYTVKKIEVPVVIPEQFSLSTLLAEYPSVGEELMPEEEEEEEASEPVQPDQALMGSLLDMGLDEFQASQALIATNNAGVEVALEFAFLPESEKEARLASAKSNSKSKKSTVNPELLATLVSMNFSQELSEIALKRASNNLEAAADLLLTDQDSLVSEANQPEEEAEQEYQHWGSTTELPEFTLRATVLHKGTSMQTGHYVAVARCDDGQWCLFNDERVTSGLNLKEHQENAYLYFYERS